jgi:hypothetical protein
MRRLLSVAGVVAMVGGATLGSGVARADQHQCANGLPFGAYACVDTTNSGGVSGDEHIVSVTAYEEVPTFGLGLGIFVTCDDEGGQSTAVIHGNVGTETPIALPVPCPGLP